MQARKVRAKKPESETHRGHIGRLDVEVSRSPTYWCLKEGGRVDPDHNQDAISLIVPMFTPALHMEHQ